MDNNFFYKFWIGKDLNLSNYWTAYHKGEGYKREFTSMKCIRKDMKHFHKNNHKLFLDKDRKNKLLILKGANSFNFDYIIRETESIKQLYSNRATIVSTLSRWNNESTDDGIKNIDEKLSGRYKDLRAGIENSIQFNNSFVWILNKQIHDDLKRS